MRVMVPSEDAIERKQNSERAQVSPILDTLREWDECLAATQPGHRARLLDMLAGRAVLERPRPKARLRQR